jgi:nucleotide-binding universal stress UspA family protein
MFKHVLVPLDQSQLAETALDYVPKLVGPGSQITLLTVIVPPDLSFGTLYGPTELMVQTVRNSEVQYESLERQTRVQAEDYLRSASKRLAARLSDIPVQIIVQAGQDAEVIVESAESLGVDAIVMATHGRSGLSRWLLGSVTQKVLSAAPCPVLVIPNKAVREEDEP